MSDVLRAIDVHLEDLARGAVLARDKPTALQHGLLRSARDEIERLQDLLDAAQGNWDREVDELMEQRERLRAEVERLRCVSFRAQEYLYLYKKPYETAARRLLRKALKDLPEADTQAAPPSQDGK